MEEEKRGERRGFVGFEFWGADVRAGVEFTA
jgi:hypothetical protein